MSDKNIFIKKLHNIKSNRLISEKQIDFLIDNPNLHRNESINALIHTQEFIPKVLDSLINGEDISL